MTVEKLDLPERPNSIALIKAIEACIEDIATENMTPFEVLGVLDVVSKCFYEKRLSLAAINERY